MIIRIVLDDSSGDWAALYVDDNLAAEDHDIDFINNMAEFLRDNEISFSKTDRFECYRYKLNGAPDGFPIKFSELDRMKLNMYKEF